MSNQTDQTEQPEAGALMKTRAKLSLLFLMSAAPFVLAYLVFFIKPDWIPSGTTNQGELILPPLQATEVGIDAKGLFDGDQWVFVIPVGASCDDTCIEALYLSRQVKTALGKESGRVERIVLTSSPSFTDEFEDLLQQEHGRVGKVFNTGIPIETQLEQMLGRKLESSYILLMDPNGNIMMLFTLDKAGKPMLKDVKHLLKASNIG